jgi:ABC-type dipeptide/oligopeptide/nickel transport system permease component
MRCIKYLPSFLIGSILVFLFCWSLGWLPPSHVPYCYTNDAGNKECATYNIVLVAFWQIGKAFNWISPAITAIATAFIGIFTATIYYINKRQLAHTHTIERAYVRLSHCDLPLSFSSTED